MTLTLAGLLEALLNEVTPLSMTLVLSGVLEALVSVTKMSLALGGVIETAIVKIVISLELGGVLEAFATLRDMRLSLGGSIEALTEGWRLSSLSLAIEGVMGALASAIRLSLGFMGSIQQTLVDLSALAGKIQLGLGGVLQALLVAPKILNLKTLMYIVAFFGFLTYYARTLEDLIRSGAFYNITIFLVRVALAPLILTLVLSIIGSIPDIRIVVSENGLEVSIG